MRRKLFRDIGNNFHNEIEPDHEIFVLFAQASSECSDETVHLHSLVRAFTARKHTVRTYVKAHAKFDTSSPTR